MPPLHAPSAAFPRDATIDALTSLGGFSCLDVDEKETEDTILLSGESLRKLPLSTQISDLIAHKVHSLPLPTSQTASLRLPSLVFNIDFGSGKLD